MPAKHHTDHLTLDESDLVWLEAEPDRIKVGRISEDPDWPLRSPKPAWFDGEFNELYEVWLDACRFGEGCRAEANDAYLRGKGFL